MSPDRALGRAKDQLLDLLSRLPQGGKLPGERALSEEYGVSRVTLRRAIEDLILDGRIERRARSGNYVRRPVISSEMRLKSFSEEIRERGQRPSTQIIQLKRIKANKTVAKALRIVEGEEVYVLDRVRFADNQPVALESLRIACSAAPGLTEADVAASLYDTLFEKFGIRISNARAAISATKPSAKDLKLLQIDNQTPCLLIKMLDMDQYGNPVMLAECIYRSDLYELKIDVTSNTQLQNSKRVS